MRATIVVAVMTVTLAVASAASAQVTVQPTEAPAGDFMRLDVRVPNEHDAGTTKVEVQFPPGFIFVSTEPVAGWTAKVTKRRLAKPVEAFGEEQTEEVDTVTWTGDVKTGIVKPGEFQDFGLSVGTPEEPGQTLTFKALQTYAGGEVVRWIGPPDSDEPAPQIALTSVAEPGAAATEPPSQDEDEGAPVWLVIVALALGALGLLAGIGALLRSR